MIEREQILEQLWYDRKSIEKYGYLKIHNIELTDMQLNLMFINRQYGKTFMDMCDLMYCARNYDNFYVAWDAEEIPSGERLFIPQDPDIMGLRMRKDNYLYALLKFIEKYFPEYTTKLNRTNLHVTKGVKL